MTKQRSYPIPTRHYPPTSLPTKRVPRLDYLGGFIGATVLVFVAAGLVAGPLIVAWGPADVNTGRALEMPSADHWLGTDMFGRDVFSRLVHGGRLSVVAGFVAVAIAVVVGSLAGVLAGYRAGFLDKSFSAVADILLAFPALLLALVLAWILGKGTMAASIGVGVASIPVYFRLSRAAVRRVRRSMFVRAAYATGVPEWAIVTRHILPNALLPIVSVAALDLGWAILHISSISYLGLGARAPQPEWGLMLSESRLYLRQVPWLGLAPGLAIALTVLGINLVADYLQSRAQRKRARYL